MSRINDIIDERQEEIDAQYRAACERIGADRFAIWLLDSEDNQASQIIRALLKTQRASVGHFEAWRASCMGADSLAIMIAPIEIQRTAQMLIALSKKAARQAARYRQMGSEYLAIVVAERGVRIVPLPKPLIEVPYVDKECPLEIE